ncbi:MAG: NAD(P)-dependent oxidoreductase [Alphaproteobacteria bacterium]|nr:NAD(P)-dependent oxidoreductase [Alphaproteobacteria bacterium]
MSDLPRVGFVGVGLMGRGMAANLMAKGFPLSVLVHRNRAPVEGLLAKGAGEAASPRALAEASDVIILCLPNSRVVEEVALGADGVIEAARPGLVVLDATTAEPAATRRIAAALAARGVDMLDTPMTMTPKEADAGTLNVLVGGDEAVLARVRPVLDAYARNVFHIGPIGAAHALKLINNFMSMTMSALIAEAATTARASGVDLGKLREVVSAGAVNSGMFQKIMAYAVDGDPSGLQFAIANARKDIGYYTDIAAEAGLPSPFGSAALQLYTLACATGHGDKHVPLMVDVMAELGGLAGERE